MVISYITTSETYTRSHDISSVITYISPTLETWSLAETLNNKWGIKAVNSGERRSLIIPEELARNWNIDLQSAKSTIWAKKQRLLRSMVWPTLK